MTRWGCVAIIAIGCGHAAPPVPTPAPKPVVAIDAGVIDAAPPVPLEQDFPRLALRGLALFQDWARALSEAGDDCAAATSKISALVDNYADVIAANTAIIHHGGRDKVKAMRAALEPYDEQMEVAAKAIAKSSTMAKCHDDPAFAHAIDRIGGEP